MRTRACIDGQHRDCPCIVNRGTTDRPRDDSCSCACHQKPKRRSSHVDHWVRAAVKERDGGRCVYTGSAGRCTTAAVHVHHILPVARGGTDDPEGLASLCAKHHEWVHANPTEAKARGLLA